MSLMDKRSKVLVSKEYKFYTVEELGDIFKTTAYTIRKWLREKRIVGKKIGKAWYIPKNSIDEFFKGG
jgi:excisionase family DNA binding protein